MGHPIFAGNISDFQVHFAADANNDGEIDRAGPTGQPSDAAGAGDPIVWYGSYDTGGSLILPDGTPGTSFDFNSNGWDSSSGATTEVEDYNPFHVAALTNARWALTWRHDDGAAFAGDGVSANSKWPYLIRIRYRLHDPRGKVTSSVWGGRDGKDNDGDGLVDNNDNSPAAGDEDRYFPMSGRWFEVIVPVNRP